MSSYVRIRFELADAVTGETRYVFVIHDTPMDRDGAYILDPLRAMGMVQDVVTATGWQVDDVVFGTDDIDYDDSDFADETN